MYEINVLKPLTIPLETTTISIKDYSDNLHKMEADPGIIFGLVFNKDMKGLEALKYVTDIDVVVRPKDLRVSPTHLELQHNLTPENNYEGLTGVGVIKGVLYNSTQNYTHCEFNTYDTELLYAYCSKNSIYYKTDKCNENCPFYKPQKVYIGEQLYPRFFETLAITYDVFADIFDGYTQDDSIDPQVINYSNNPLVLENTEGINATSFADNLEPLNDLLIPNLNSDFFAVLNKFYDFTSSIAKIIQEIPMSSPIFSEDINVQNFADLKSSKIDILVPKRSEINDTFSNVKILKNGVEIPISAPEILSPIKRVYVEKDITYVIDIDGNVWAAGKEKEVESYEEFVGYEIVISVPDNIATEGADQYVVLNLATAEVV